MSSIPPAAPPAEGFDPEGFASPIGDAAEERRTSDALVRVGLSIASERTLESIVQRVTDEGTALCRAAFGAFFYNVPDGHGGSYSLYTLSKMAPEAFARFPMPRATPIFGPTFAGAGIVRSDDITQDPRYGQVAPHHGMPPGHPPVKSYLGVPVVSRSGEVLGGLFFGHPRPGVFSARDERVISAVAAHAAVAIDTARLQESLRRSVTETDRSEERFRAAQELSLQGFAIFEPVREDGRIVDFRWVYRNPRAAELLPSRSPDLTGKRLLEEMPELAKSSDFARYVEVVERGIPIKVEQRLQFGEREQWLQISAIKLGEGLAVSYDDVTERKEREQEHAALIVRERQATAAARLERQDLHRLFMEAPAAIVIVRGPEHVIELANPRYCTLIGKRDLVGKRFRDAVPEVEGQGVMEMYDRVFRTGEPFEGKEFPVKLARRGTDELDECLFNFTAQPIRDAAGRIDGVMGFGVEVTDEVRARQRLQAVAEQLSSEQGWLESVLDQMPTALTLIDPTTGRMTFANSACDALYGGTMPRAEDLASFGEAYRVTNASGVPIPVERLPAARAIRGETITAEQLIWHTPAGSRSLLVFGALLPAAFGHAATALVAFVDISAQKQAEAALQEAVRVRDDFLTVASHELNTPLTPLLTQVQLLRRKLPDSPENARMLSLAERQVVRLAKLVTDLLDVSRISGGKMRFEPEVVDLAEVVREVVDRLPESARARVQLQGEATLMGEWDPLRIDQVVTNLVSNALKYGGTAPVQVSLRGEREQVVLVIADQGIGIAEEEQARIFQRFERAVPTRNYGGFGIGLWITRHVVEGSGGKITVQSALGKGSTFTVTLPRHPPR
jgi:PAS domain S-box-containing protein